MLFTLLAFAVALGLLITFHELGHYWVARRCGVRVLRFSVGFGRVVLRRTDKHGTEWALSAIPLGGYVKMQDDPPEHASDTQRAESFNCKTVGQRFAIVAAGPVANLVLAALLYAGLNMAGTQEPAALLAAPAPGTPAAVAGVQSGDRVVAVDGTAVQSWGEARWALLDKVASGGQAGLQLQTQQGIDRTLLVAFEPADMSDETKDPLAQAGLSLMAPAVKVGQLVAGGAGEAAGLQQGDVIVRVGAIADPDPQVFVETVQAHAGQTLPLVVSRQGAELSLSVQPRPEPGPDGAPVGRIGVMLGADFPMVSVSYGPFDSLWRGVVRTVDTAWFSLKMMGRMVTGDVSVRNISGPVTIADYAGQSARVGLAAYIGFLALISVSIGVLNLLPIPMLDGGHLMYYVAEIIRGKPLPDAWLEHGQRVGLALLAGLMGVAFFNDFVRLLS